MNDELLAYVRGLERRIGALERQERPAPGLAGLADVDVSAPSLNQVLQYGAGSAWENRSDLTVAGFIRAQGVVNPRIRMIQHTLANNTSAQLGHTASIFGWVFVSSSSDGAGALFFCQGGGNTVQEITDPSNRFSTVAGTASMTNIYWNAAGSDYRIQNLRGSSQSYEIMFIAR